jgi:hypothetical protein
MGFVWAYVPPFASLVSLAVSLPVRGSLDPSYNSAVFASLSSNNYFAFSVSKSFVEDVDCLGCINPINRDMAISRSKWKSEPMGSQYIHYYPKDIPTVLQNLHRTVRDLDRLEPAECLNQYATSIQTKRRNLLLVASNEHFPTIQQNNFSSGSHVYWASPFYSYTVELVGDSANAYSWMCSGLDREGDCADNIDKIKADPSAWRVGAACSNKTASLTSSPVCQDGAFPVEYCLSEPAEPHCRLQFDTTISVIVTVLNLSKLHLNYTHRSNARLAIEVTLLACTYRHWSRLERPVHAC